MIDNENILECTVLPFAVETLSTGVEDTEAVRTTCKSICHFFESNKILTMSTSGVWCSWRETQLETNDKVWKKIHKYYVIYYSIVNASKYIYCYPKMIFINIVI